MNSTKTLFRSTQIVWYLFAIIEALLVFRFLLKLLGANAGATFTQIVYNFSGIFVAPFQYVFTANTVGGSVIEWSTLLALLVYYLVALGLIKLLSMSRNVSTEEASTTLQDQEKS